MHEWMYGSFNLHLDRTAKFIGTDASLVFSAVLLIEFVGARHHLSFEQASKLCTELRRDFQAEGLL